MQKKEKLNGFSGTNKIELNLKPKQIVTYMPASRVASVKSGSG